MRLAASHVAIEHEVLGPVHETEAYELRASPVRGGKRRYAQSYPSNPLTHGKPTFLISRARPDSDRLPRPSPRGGTNGHGSRT